VPITPKQNAYFLADFVWRGNGIRMSGAEFWTHYPQVDPEFLYSAFRLIGTLSDVVAASFDVPARPVRLVGPDDAVSEGAARPAVAVLLDALADPRLADLSGRQVWREVDGDPAAFRQRVARLIAVLSSVLECSDRTGRGARNAAT
jgi:hypothetical protein